MVLCLKGNDRRCRAGVIEQGPRITERTIAEQEAANRAVKSPPNDGFSHIVATCKDSGPPSRQRKLASWDPQKEEAHSIPLLPEVTYQPKMAPTGEGRLGV